MHDIIVGFFIFAILNAIAYKWVGDLYRGGLIESRFIGSFLKGNIYETYPFRGETELYTNDLIQCESEDK